MSHVFISYMSQNGEFAAELTRQLEDAGFQVWADNERLRAGDQWREAIDQALADAFAVIVLLTPAAKTSEQIKYEWIYALGSGAEVIPIILEATDLHPRLARLEQLEFGDEAAPSWGKLIRRVQSAYDQDRRRAASMPPSARFGDRLRRPGPPPYPSRYDPGRPENPAREEDDTIDAKDVKPGDPEEVDKLIKALEHPDREARSEAAQRLGKIGDKKSVQPLIKLLRDEEWQVRDAAAVALGKMKAASAVIGLLETIRFRRPGPFGAPRSNTDVVTNAIRAIGAASVPVLLDALSDEDPRIRLYVTDVLGEIGEADAIPALAAALRDPEWRVRFRAADALGKMGDREAVPDLIDMLKDSNKDVRISVAWALGKIGNKSAVPGLIDLLHDREWRVRWAAAEALWEIGTESIPPLIEALREKDEYVRRAAVRALVEIGEPAIEPLIATLGDSNWDVRWSAASALQEIGDPSVGPLVTALDSGNWQAAWAAAETLKRLGTPEALAAVENWRGNEDKDADGEPGAGADVSEDKAPDAPQDTNNS
ncbi:MAG: HEAT repeat domain-containing protein [Anaerolineae bacterium]|nr:HEAT repeat domain-containing protein [Anaerolineae bacterium]